ncbi:MAG: sigma 54-interacting transcriptional regulator [Treponema sp.]|jgi:PAS domain S-box-containing protein|nr:sigma 54-interacting transcriptional regulator [Treponema sp.]
MQKILLLAQGEHIAAYAEKLRKTLPFPDEMEVQIAHMEDAVRIGRVYEGTDTAVIIARGTTADLLRESGISIPVVEIPVSDEEIIYSVNKARKIAGKDGLIGFLGFKNVIASVQCFLEAISIKIRLYEIHTTQDTLEQIEHAMKDGVSVLISGVRSIEMIKQRGIKAVLMPSSYNSVLKAYQQAKQIIYALALEKKKNEETIIIFNSVSDAILSIDRDGKITMANKLTSLIFGQKGESLTGLHISAVFSLREQESIFRVLETGEELLGSVLERQNRNYAMRIVPIVIEKTQEGAVITLQDITSLQQMETNVRRRLSQKQGNMANYVFSDIRYESPQMKEAVEMARRFARLQSNVLLIGETGTGKELFAQSIHNASPRTDSPFVAFNCGAIHGELMESELFGYEEGAFTGAKKGGKMGLFELAHGGTLFLDEISEMKKSGQVMLLRALQERQIRRIGGRTNIPVDLRVIAACNVNLYDQVQKNNFRKDLYYRLSVLILKIPPLRSRTDDISLLARFFIDEYNRQFGRNLVLSASALREMEAFHWDGNIRQLKNFCERISVIADNPEIDGNLIRQELNNSYWFEQKDTEHPPPQKETAVPEAVSIKGRIYARDDLLRLLKKNGENREACARELRISRTTFWKYLKIVGI